MIDQEVIQQIRDEANDKIDLLFEELGIDIEDSVGYLNEVRCKCPIHDGADNPTAFCYSFRTKTWSCYSSGCHKDRSSIFGLVQSVIEKKEKREVRFPEAVKWVADRLGQTISDDKKIDPEQKELYRLIKNSKIQQKFTEETSVSNTKNNKYPFPLNKINGRIVPSKYFIDQGFSPSILQRYNVGYCDNPAKPMHLRSYVPILNENGDMVIGATGRIIYDKCQYCPLFHEKDKGCPKENPKIRGYTKWFHDGFNTSAILYNSWSSERHIKNTGVAIVTEGPKEVWKLEEYGIKNSNCLLGLNISPYHLNRLIKIGTMKLVVALDNDEKGREALGNIKNHLSNYFKIYNIFDHLSNQSSIDNIDIDELPKESFEKEIIPFLKSIEMKK